jgi:hypothetical protein
MENVIVSLLVYSTLAYLAYCFFYPPEDSIKISDKFNIGYVDEPNAQNVNVKVSVSNKPKSKKLNKPLEDNKLIEDCIETLVVLGTPKRKAQAQVKTVFDKNPNIKTVQDFITEYGKKCG